MKKYTIKLSDDLSMIYEDIAKINGKSIEECLVYVLDKAIRTLTGDHK